MLFLYRTCINFPFLHTMSMTISSLIPLPCTRSEWGLRAHWGPGGSSDWSGEKRRENVHGNHSSIGRAQSPIFRHLLFHGWKNEGFECPQWEQEGLRKLQPSLCWGKAIEGAEFVWKEDLLSSIIVLWRCPSSVSD